MVGILWFLPSLVQLQPSFTDLKLCTTSVVGITPIVYTGVNGGQPSNYCFLLLSLADDADDERNDEWDDGLATEQEAGDAAVSTMVMVEALANPELGPGWP